MFLGCVFGLCFWVVSLGCVVGLCFGIRVGVVFLGGVLGCVLGLCFWAVFSGCVLGLCLWAVFWGLCALGCVFVNLSLIIPLPTGCAIFGATPVLRSFSTANCVRPVSVDVLGFARSLSCNGISSSTGVALFGFRRG